MRAREAGNAMNGDANPLGYPAAVWRLFRETPRAGRLDAARVGHAHTPAAPFRLRLDVQLEHGVFRDSRFSAHGCPYTIATGAWLAEWLIGRRPDDLLTPPIAALRAELEIPEDRAHCWLMAQDCLRDLHRCCP
jgi:NifU-like protein involved in Fe-S cluster formation